MIKSRPYPWTCGKCRKRAVQPVAEDYATEVEHDGRVHPIRLDHFRIHRCENCGNVMLDEAADRAIDAKFREVAGLLVPAGIRAGREQLGLSQKALAGYLDVGESTVSRWETGAQVQQRVMDKVLRAFFAVPQFRAFLGFKEQAKLLPVPIASDSPTSV